MGNGAVVSSADFIRNIGHWQNEALRQPISITHHGRERLVLAAPDLLASETSTASNDGGGLEADHALLLDNMDEGLLAFDRTGALIAANATAQAFVGRAEQQIIGARVVDCLPAPLGAILAERIQRVLRTRRSERFEGAAFDGRTLAIRAFPISDGVSVVFHNITELQTLRARLEQAEALERALQRHAAAAAIRLDARGRIESAGASFCAASGFNGADLVGHRLVDLVSPPQRREVAELIEKVLREGACAEAAPALLTKQGEPLAGVLTLSPIFADCVALGALAVWVKREGGQD